MRILDSLTGRSVGDEQDVVAGDGDIWALAYVEDGRSLLVSEGPGPHDSLKTSIVDAETLLPSGAPFDVAGNCCATSIGDGSTAMVYQASNLDMASGYVRVLDVSTGEILAETEVDLLAYTSASSPDGATVTMAGRAGEIVTVDVSTGAQRRSTSLGAAVHWLDYSDDGERLVSGAADGGVSLWDATTLELLGTVYAPQRGEPVPAGAQFIGDTHDVAIASYDGSVYRWETDVDRAIDFACEMAGRDLTEAEWAEFLPAQPYRSTCPEG